MKCNHLPPWTREIVKILDQSEGHYWLRCMLTAFVSMKQCLDVDDQLEKSSQTFHSNSNWKPWGNNFVTSQILTCGFLWCVLGASHNADDTLLHLLGVDDWMTLLLHDWHEGPDTLPKQPCTMLDLCGTFASTEHPQIFWKLFLSDVICMNACFQNGIFFLVLWHDQPVIWRKKWLGPTGGFTLVEGILVLNNRVRISTAAAALLSHIQSFGWQIVCKWNLAEKFFNFSWQIWWRT